MLPFGRVAAITTAVNHRDLYTVDGVDNGGYRMMTSGSVVGVSCQFECTAHSSDTEFRAYIRKNGFTTSDYASVTVTGTGASGATATLPPGTFLFVPGDLLEIRVAVGGSGITTENHAALMRILSSTG